MIPMYIPNKFQINKYRHRVVVPHAARFSIVWLMEEFGNRYRSFFINGQFTFYFCDKKDAVYFALRLS